MATLINSFDFYNYDGLRNVINKSKKLVKRTEGLSGNFVSGDYFRGKIRFTTEGRSGAYILSKDNYIIIDLSVEDKRYKANYFVTNIESIGSRTFEIDVEMDVLATFESQITNKNYIIEYSENNFDLYLRDNAYSQLAYPKSEILTFPSGFKSTNLTNIILSTNTK